MAKTKALSLFSGGLDSILATRVVMDQGIEVTAVNFVTPFFGNEILGDIPAYTKRIKAKFGINVIVEDISEGYLDLLHNPEHGFGKNFNPCIDCKIFMIKRAKELMAELGASFLITGEVIGQRPMSQRRDTLNVIERDSGSRTQLLRPLSARLMDPTTAELEGLIDRTKLHNFSGRGRSRQIALAKEYGITDYPSPAGGCILADPILSKRIKKVYNDEFVVQSADITPGDINLMLVGRQFLLPGGGWFILGRDEKENDKLAELVTPEDAGLHMEVRPGPFGLLRRAVAFYKTEEELKEDLKIAASLVVRFGRKVKEGPTGSDVLVEIAGTKEDVFSEPLADEVFQLWVL